MHHVEFFKKCFAYISTFASSSFKVKIGPKTAKNTKNKFKKCFLESHFTSTVSPTCEAIIFRKMSKSLYPAVYTRVYCLLRFLLFMSYVLSHLEAAVFVAVRQSLLRRRSRREMNKGEILRLLHPLHLAVVAAGEPVEEGAQRLLGGGEHEVA
jgi:hypothetical protein